jgi:hypothetical protein
MISAEEMLPKDRRFLRFKGSDAILVHFAGHLARLRSLHTQQILLQTLRVQCIPMILRLPPDPWYYRHAGFER